MGTPKYLRVYLNSIICSVAVLTATNSDPYVAISTVACFLEYQSVGVYSPNKFKLQIYQLTGTIDKWVTLIMGINRQCTGESCKMMTSALMGYSDKWQSDKKVPHVENLNSLAETNPSVHEPT